MTLLDPKTSWFEYGTFGPTRCKECHSKLLSYQFKRKTFFGEKKTIPSNFPYFCIIVPIIGLGPSFKTFDSPIPKDALICHTWLKS